MQRVSMLACLFCARAFVLEIHFRRFRRAYIRVSQTLDALAELT